MLDVDYVEICIGPNLAADCIKPCIHIPPQIWRLWFDPGLSLWRWPFRQKGGYIYLQCSIVLITVLPANCLNRCRDAKGVKESKGAIDCENC